MSGAYKNNFGDLDYSATVGGEWFSDQGRVATAVNTVDGLVSPGQYFIANSRSLRGNSGSDQGYKRISSVYFLLNASWKRQFYLDITGRNDWSSALVYTNATGNYSYFYPSVGSSWIFSETFDMPSWLVFGKLKLSWAQVGNDTSPYSINQTYGAASTEMPDASLVQRQTFGRTVVDPRLKPERKNAFEAGTDLMFADNRIGLEFTYYKENTRDQIISIATPLESGINSQRINAGNVQNQGVEIALRSTPVRGTFQWDMDVLYAKNVNKIVELHPDVGDYMQLVDASGDFRIRSVAYVGGEYGTLLSDVKPKVDPVTGKQLLMWEEGRKMAYPIRSNTLEKVGKIEPDFTGSITNTFSWKGISASVLLDVRWGGYIASYTNLYGFGYGMTKNSLRNRDTEHGGITFKSINEEKYLDGHDGVFHDGFIPDGVFQPGTLIKDVNGGPDIDVSEMTYQQAVDAGIVDPAHAPTWNSRTYEWATFTLNDDWFSEVKYIGVRQISLGYNIPRNITRKLGVSNLRVAIEAQNVGYLYNSLPNKLNPQSFGGNANNTFMERLLTPYVGSYNFSLRFDL
ncbi:MAG: TonB-dependent receptor [Bacteroidales bacterium]|nr:TonB-dependent receptor [Bacteroidales bacterium]